MGFAAFPNYQPAVRLLQRSLERGRLGHAYLFVGGQIESLQALARTLVKTLNCENQPKPGTRAGPPDSCDRCSTCRKTDLDQHPDVTWLRPESKTRVIRVDQVRELIRTVNLKPAYARHKAGILVAADRLKEEAANAFLKTLEEPPPQSILILITSDPASIPETVLSRCLRLRVAGEAGWDPDEGPLTWLRQFGDTALREQGSLLSRYRLLSVLLKQLGALREAITRAEEQASPLESMGEVEPQVKEKWEDELAAAIEAEYRRRRSALLAGLHRWLRDVWLGTLAGGQIDLAFPSLQDLSQAVAKRLTPAEAMANLQTLERTQWLLGSNVQEALALEVGLLRLKL